MAKIVRKFMKIFGSTAGPQQLGVFGSLAAGSPAYSTDPETIQSLANYEEGWYGAVLGNNSPAIQDMNALQYLFAYQLAYLSQTGIPEWNAATTYYIGSLATGVGTGIIYMSRTNANLNNAVSDNTNWKIVGGDIMSAGGDLIYGGTNGNQTRLPNGAVDQYLASAGGTSPPVWTSFVTGTKQIFTVTGTVAGQIFTISSGNATVGATYTNNGQTFTVLATIAAQTTVYMSGTGSPLTSGTLTKSAGTGDATLTFSAAQALAVYTTPARAKLLKLTLVGAGGAGGGAGATAAGSSAAGAGGGAGATVIKFITSPAATYYYAVGVGGTVGAAGNNAGNAGSRSFFDIVLALSAGGGSGGGGGPTQTGGPVIEQNFGGAGGAAANGDVNIPGGAGNFSIVYAATVSSSGYGGTSTLGAGGRGVAAGAGAVSAGTVGSVYGGGGGGGVGQNAAAQTGGAGAGGIIIVEEMY